jgi:4-carboxymuconolactone decarboxylase
MALMDDAELRARTKRTSQTLFHTLKGGSGFETWKRFDKGLARELSLFFTGRLYSRDVIPQRDRELCAVAALTVLNRLPELRAHCHAALNVGATRQEVAEVIFQMVTYGGMPVVVEGLHTLKDVLVERGEWTE